MSILAVLEQAGGAWHRQSREALAAAQQLGKALGRPASAALLGRNLAPLGAELAAKRLERVFLLEDALLAPYTADAYVVALEQLIRARQPSYVVFPHTYQVRDFAPRLAARFRRWLLSDVTGWRLEDGTPVFVRQIFQGRLNADLRPSGAGPVFVSVQAGAFALAPVEEGVAEMERFEVRIEAAAIRTRPEAPLEQAPAAVDLAKAERIVAVGRGIKDRENLRLVEELAAALGAELAASRPVCDNGWLPLERQVGSSGQTVAPKLYLAVGISGAIQHLVGMKGSRTVVAINRDPAAPIFEVADYGIVGDLFEVVPALIGQLRRSRD